MASIRKQITLDASPDDVWDALRDWGAVHERLVPGFLLDAKVDGEDRIVTFFNGAVVRELFVDLDEDSRRLVWAVRDDALGLEHYMASAQVAAEPDGETTFIWLADLLPHSAAATVEGLMEQGLAAIRTTLERARA
jgi:hypothetical protein